MWKTKYIGPPFDFCRRTLIAVVFATVNTIVSAVPVVKTVVTATVFEIVILFFDIEIVVIVIRYWHWY